MQDLVDFQENNYTKGYNLINKSCGFKNGRNSAESVWETQNVSK